MNLREYQARWAQALLGEGPSPPAMLDTEQARNRLDIYRNHYVLSLVEALQATYPQVWRYLGQQRFVDLARRHAIQHSPRSGCLTHYGETFPDSLRTALKEEESWVCTLAELEWRVERAALALAPTAFPFADLARLAEEDYARIILTPADGVQSLIASYPVATAYDRLFAGQLPDPPAPGIECLVIYPQREGVGITQLSPQAWAVLAMAFEGRPLDDIDGGLTDLHCDALLMLVQLGVLAGFRLQAHARSVVRD